MLHLYQIAVKGLRIILEKISDKLINCKSGGFTRMKSFENEEQKITPTV